MARIGVGLKIDVSKIDKSKLFSGKNGAKYLDATVFVDTDNPDQYGNNGMITQSQTKEEKDSGTYGAILGNCKVFWNDGGNQQTNNQSNNNRQSKPNKSYDDFDDD